MMSRSQTTEEERALLARARTLDPQALAEVHDTYYVAIYRYIAFRVEDNHTAEDLASDVFLRLLNALNDKNAPQNTLRGWLYGVASRVISDHHRRRYRKRETELSDAMPSSNPGPAESLMTNLRHEALYEAMQQLTEDQQEVIALRYGYGLSIREVADTVGKSEGAVKQLQARGVAALHRFLSPEALD